MSVAQKGLVTEISSGNAPRTAEQIRRDIERRRETIARAVASAEQKMEGLLDWRAQTREHPYAALALAASAGFSVATFLPRDERPSTRLMSALTEGVEGISSSLRDSSDGSAAGPREGIGRALSTAATAVAARWLVRALRDALTDESTIKPNQGESHES